MSAESKISKELDSFFTGIGLAISFFIAAAILALDSDYFGSAIATNITMIIFLIFGAAGLNTEIQKYTKKSVDLNGGELLGAIVFLGPWYWLQFQPHAWGWNVLYVTLLIFGVTFAVRWIMSMGNRFIAVIRLDSISARLKVATLVLTQVAALLAIIIKIAQSIKLIE